MAKHYIYRFKAELQDYKPKILRTFEIDGGKTMAELGYILQIMFEMQASHLFCFRDNVVNSKIKMVQKTKDYRIKIRHLKCLRQCVKLSK